MSSTRILCCAVGAGQAQQSRAELRLLLLDGAVTPLLSLVSPLCWTHSPLSGLGHAAFPAGAGTGPELQGEEQLGAAAGHRHLSAQGLPLILSGSPALTALSPHLLSKPLAAAIPVHPCRAPCGSLSPLSPPSHSPLLAPAPNPALGDSRNHSLQHVQLLPANDD